MNVLVATPMRSSTPPELQARCQSIYNSLTYSPKGRMVFVNDFESQAHEAKYMPNARARNVMVESILDNLTEVTHVLWLDADIVAAPEDLIEQLSATSQEHIVAPVVFTEKLDPDGPASFTNGGWFYDTGGFIQDGRWTHPFHPVFHSANGDPNVVELDSVGCCYLVPLEVYRQGARYDAADQRIEHEFFMAQARALGYRVLARVDVRIEHAFLPKYGVTWHG